MVYYYCQEGTTPQNKKKDGLIMLEKLLYLLGLLEDDLDYQIENNEIYISVEPTVQVYDILLDWLDDMANYFEGNGYDLEWYEFDDFTVQVHYI